ncbi:hypothetical protein [Castellaniella sp. S9]|uniref:hypothetical protein n=1 Tax=Castellaniella sp. S9 TaxID=2993652 RepID=UPI0022B4413D|nr:hypothetical protein [Castellaniella sp. S9]
MHSQVITEDMIGKERRGSWSSYALGKGKDLVLRAFSVATHTTTGLAIDMAPESCGTNLSFIFPYDAPLDRDLEMQSVQIDARIDSGGIFYLLGMTKGTMGDEFGIIYLNATDRYSALIDAMRAGNTVRFKISRSSGEYISTEIFSLSGLTYSLNRIGAACGEISSAASRGAPDANLPRVPAKPERGLKSLLYRP